MTFQQWASSGGMHDKASACLLGDEVIYTPDGKPALKIMAFVNFGNEDRRVGGSTGIDIGYDIRIPKSQIATEPSDADRLVITLRPGKTYRPIYAGESEDGVYWLCTLKTVVA